MEIIRYRDSFGEIQAMPVPSSMAQALRALDRRQRRLDAHWRARHRTFTDLEWDAGGIFDRARAGIRADGYAPEVAPFAFGLWLGEEPWCGPDWLWRYEPESRLWLCRFCGHLWELPALGYCLGCDRSGRDREIGHPRRADPARERIQDPRGGDGLAGGRGAIAR